MHKLTKEILELANTTISIDRKFNTLDMIHFAIELDSYLTSKIFDDLKLYAFQPSGHTEDSAFVMSTDIISARKAVEDATQRLRAEHAENSSTYVPNIGNLELYDMHIVDINIPVFNSND